MRSRTNGRKKSGLRWKSSFTSAQKLESIGHLAAGIAHEINTPTQFVGDNTRFLRDAFGDLIKLIDSLDRLAAAARGGRVDQDLLDEVERARSSADIGYLRAEIPKAIDQSLEGIQRVSKIVRAMKEFSHPDLGEKVATDLNRAIETTVTVARNEWKYVAEMKLDLDPTLPMVACIPGEINQVILNLIVNCGARDRGQGRRRGPQARGRSRSARGGMAMGWKSASRIREPESRRNTGHGCLMPFFTTKTVGKGTGQGLGHCLQCGPQEAWGDHPLRNRNRSRDHVHYSSSPR